MLEGIEATKPHLLLVFHNLNDEVADVFQPLVKEKFPILKIIILTILAD